MKHVKSLLLPAAFAIAFGNGFACAQADPSIPLPPVEVILKAAAELGAETVNVEYVKSKLPDLIAKTGKVFVIDSRPARNYDEGYIPTSYNIYDAKFPILYPEFEKLNLPKDTEIILGLGRPCPMSLSNIKQLKAKGYTNMKAFVKGPDFFTASYVEVTAKGAKKHVGNGAVLVNLKDDPTLDKFLAANAEKDKPVLLVGDKANAPINYAAAAKVYGTGFKRTLVFNGDITAIQ